MYQLAVVMLRLAVLLLAYSAVLLCLAGGWPGWVLLGLLVMVALKRKGRVFTTLGSARLATEEEMRQAGMVGGKGLILGWLPKKKMPERLKALFSRGSAKNACKQFMGTRELITLPPSTVHVSVFGPTGAGKGASLIIPWLLSVDESAVVVDLKGELALLTSEARRRMGHRIVILDPFKVVTQ
jgi:type IV secretion system protein VirD4